MVFIRQEVAVWFQAELRSGGAAYQPSHFKPCHITGVKSHEILLETFNEIFTEFFIARKFHEILHHY